MRNSREISKKITILECLQYGVKPNSGFPMPYENKRDTVGNYEKKAALFVVSIYFEWA